MEGVLLFQLISNIVGQVAASSIYDSIKRYLQRSPKIDLNELKSVIQNSILLNGQFVNSDAIINFMVNNGTIKISACDFYAPNEIRYSSTQSGQLSFIGSSSKTCTSSIQSKGPLNEIQLNGESSIHQSSDGKVSFYVGDDINSSIKVYISKD